jgi:hypothetical protein
LVGAGGVGPGALQGWSVALSSDGNTAIVGGPFDNGNIADGIGAAWVYTRLSGVWSQQTKLIGTGSVGLSEQGSSVALSSDGNTALVGGLNDNDGIGAAWVYTRSDGVWSQQGVKLVATDAVGPVVFQGRSVALSGDGSTAIVGGEQDNGATGAAWIYTRSGELWSETEKLVGSGKVGQSEQGFSVSLSGGRQHCHCRGADR